MAYDVTSDAYRAKLAQAVGSGAPVPKIATVVVGTGGQDQAGERKVPLGTDTSLFTQVLSKPTGAPTYPTPTSAQFTITINPGDLPANTKINEAGLIDNSGSFAAHSTFYAKATDGTTTMTINVAMQL